MTIKGFQTTAFLCRLLAHPLPVLEAFFQLFNISRISAGAKVTLVSTRNLNRVSKILSISLCGGGGCVSALRHFRLSYECVSLRRKRMSVPSHRKNKRKRTRIKDLIMTIACGCSAGTVRFTSFSSFISYGKPYNGTCAENEFLKQHDIAAPYGFSKCFAKKNYCIKMERMPSALTISHITKKALGKNLFLSIGWIYFPLTSWCVVNPSDGNFYYTENFTHSFQNRPSPTFRICLFAFAAPAFGFNGREEAEVNVHRLESVGFGIARDVGK